MPDIMQAKLIHAQAVVEGIVLGELAQVEANASQLAWISEESAWMVHDTASYVVFSEQFRAIMHEMARHARGGDLDAVIRDYGRMTNSCVACHTYLRQEKLIKDLPGRVSSASPVREDPATRPDAAR